MSQTTYQGITFTGEDVRRAMHRFDEESRATFPPGRWVTYAIKHDEKLYPPKQIIRLVTGLQNVVGGGRPVNSRFEELGFTVVTIDEDQAPDNGGSVDTETEIAFSLEYDLENSLITNLEQLEKGLRLYKNNGTSGQQFDTRGAGRIDILAVDANDDFVVIELNADSGETDQTN